MMYNCNNHKTIFSHNKGVPVANSIHHSNSIYNYFKSLKLGLFLSDVYLNHLMIIMVSVFLRGYRGKTIDFAEVSCMHRTTTAYFLNHGKWDDSALQDILKARVIHRAYFYKNMDGYKARIGKEAEIKLESIVRTRKEKEINQVIHSILEDIIIKEESAQKLYMAVVEILKILGNYYAELYQDEDIEELKDIKVMFSRRYDLYKFKHIEELENYLKEMVIVICSGKENTKKKSKIVEEIVHYVENNYYKNISLRELAENKYFVNYSYCSRLFSQETGMNFSKYLIQYRLKKAKTLLENKDMKISFIAFEVGYNDVSHFIQSFKKSYGLTPEEYRARKKIE